MNRASVLLINPWIYDFAAYDLWAKPLGLLYLASLLRINGYEVKFIDCLDMYHPDLDKEPGLKRGVRRRYGTGRFYRQRMPKPLCLKDIPRYYYRYGLSHRLFVKELNRIERPQAILVTSAMTYWYPGVFEVIRVCKGIWPGVPIILGGIYATLCYSHARSYSGADFVIKGPAEGQILSLLEEITGKRPSIFLDSPSLDDLPYPAFDLIRKIDYVCLLTSRGCPFRCPYCASHILQPRFYQRKPEGVFREILFWHRRYGVREFAFYDDALLINAKEHIAPILEMVIAEGIKVNFHTPNGLHIRFIDTKLSRLMYKAGFKVIRLGLETASDENRLEKKTNYEEFIQAISYLKEAGFRGEQIGVYLLMGLPHQDPREVEEAIKLVKGQGVVPHLAEYSPIPGTKLWQEAIRCSRYDLENEPLTQNNSAMPCLSEKFSWANVKRLKELRFS